jgi:hypothetical protein
LFADTTACQLVNPPFAYPLRIAYSKAYPEIRGLCFPDTGRTTFKVSFMVSRLLIDKWTDRFVSNRVEIQTRFQLFIIYRNLIRILRAAISRGPSMFG